MPKLVKCLIVAVFVSTSLGCSTTKDVAAHKESDLSFDESDQASPAKLSSEQVRSDISLLIYGLENGYGGRKYVPQDLFQTALRNLRSIDASFSPSDLRDQIDAALLLIPDNHLKARLDGRASQARVALEKKANVGKNAISSPTKTWEVRLDKKKGKRILFISITHFPSGKDEIWKGFIDQAKSKLSKSDLTVIDMRGNGGGDDEKGFALAKVFLGHDVVSPVEKQFFSQTPETFEIAKNGYLITKHRLTQKEKLIPGYLNDRIQELDDKLKLSLQGKLPEERVEVNPNKFAVAKTVTYRKPIFILMDGECASSCESTIDAFESHPMVKRVGENTGGYIHFGDIGQLILPVSRVNVQIPTKHDEYFDHRFLERVGITPDIKVSPGTDAYEYVVKQP